MCQEECEDWLSYNHSLLLDIQNTSVIYKDPDVTNLVQMSSGLEIMSCVQKYTSNTARCSCTRACVCNIVHIHLELFYTLQQTRLWLYLVIPFDVFFIIQHSCCCITNSKYFLGPKSEVSMSQLPPSIVALEQHKYGEVGPSWEELQHLKNFKYDMNGHEHWILLYLQKTWINWLSTFSNGINVYIGHFSHCSVKIASLSAGITGVP